MTAKTEVMTTKQNLYKYCIFLVAFFLLSFFFYKTTSCRADYIYKTSPLFLFNRF